MMMLTNLPENPEVDDVGNQYIKGICSQLRPNNAVHAEDQIHQQHNGNVQTKLPDHSQIERGFTPAHSLHKMDHMEAHEHHRCGETAASQELDAVADGVGFFDEGPDQPWGSEIIQCNADSGHTKTCHPGG